jgi:hypothetical protein
MCFLDSNSRYIFIDVSSPSVVSPAPSATESVKAKEKEKQQDELSRIVDAVTLKLSKLKVIRYQATISLTPGQTVKDYPAQVERLVNNVTGGKKIYNRIFF